MTGDRIGVQLPAGRPVPVMTRYGPLSLSPDVLAGIAFNTDDTGVHTITLTDGSHFGGLVTMPALTATLTAAGTSPTAATTAPTTAPTTRGADTGMTVEFPIGSLGRLVFAGDEAGSDPSADHATADDAPALHVRKDDLLVGTLTGTLKVDTAFDVMSVDAAQVRSMTPSKDNPADMAITTWDGTTFNGQVEDPTVVCHLSCGVDVRVPVSLIDGYTNPPRPYRP